MHQQIDLETIKEFMKETLSKVEKSALIKIANELEEKHIFFKSVLKTDTIADLSIEDLESLLNRIFAAKRKKKKIIALYSIEHWQQSIGALLNDSDDIERRFQSFCVAIDKVDVNTRRDITSEILHFTYPSQYWLWTRWMWDAKLKTGALPLVVTEDFDLEGGDFGKRYMKVGKGVAFVHSVAEMAGFKYIHNSLFGTDVFLSCVYVIYAYTILRMRMTQEFNKVMPSLIEFSRRLLGVYGIKTNHREATVV